MKNLFHLDDLTTEQIINILDRANEFAKGEISRAGKGKTVANLFFEPSTRTHYSFDVAANKIGAKTINFNAETSSLKKGETLYDTAKTFESFGVDAIVIRHGDNEYYKNLVNINVPIISGGDGTGNHPTQSLLDLLTIYQEFNKFKDVNVTIIGDIKHSRVANTNIKVMQRLGMNVWVSGPTDLVTNNGNYIDLDRALLESDVIMLLRVQHERHSSKHTTKEYNEKFGLNKSRIIKMKEKAIILHPGPFNRGVELTDEIVECEKSRIWKQVANGVAIRQAILEEVLNDI